MAIWDDATTPRDKQVLDACGYGRVRGLGARPALIVIDMNYNWVGDRREPVLESIKRIRHSCGEEAWDAVDTVRALLDKARRKKIPVIYTTGYGPENHYESKRRPWKNHRHEEDETMDYSARMKIVAEIAPAPLDIVIQKAKPSGFFGTPLHAVLNDYAVDTLLVTRRIHERLRPRDCRRRFFLQLFCRRRRRRDVRPDPAIAQGESSRHEHEVRRCDPR